MKLWPGDPAQGSLRRYEWAAEEWRRLVEQEKNRLRRRRSFWFYLKNLVMRRIIIRIEWRNPR